jgi:hypothetical protein
MRCESTSEIPMIVRSSCGLMMLSAVAACSLTTLAASTASSDLQVARWQAHDFVFRIDAVPDKPFQVQFSVEASGPGRRAWEVYMAGGYGVCYYTYTAWDVVRPEDTPPGYAYFKHLRDLFQGMDYWRMEPADGLVSEGYCLAEPGRQYLVFQNNAQPFSLKLEGLAAPLPAVWFHPFT